ncbi:hypothetical protein HPB51_012687 [Rhipicephalus microplus]|uniref:Uncharacterized protein n=1 Tax=Rhipicephalus microplus TaxID=6941 RepID=A0A9J6D556_RHIMP|nr:hypothetical protein HPB51_012687 [Rhipicephalus microplus]
MAMYQPADSWRPHFDPPLPPFRAASIERWFVEFEAALKLNSIWLQEFMFEVFEYVYPPDLKRHRSTFQDASRITASPDHSPAGNNWPHRNLLRCALCPSSSTTSAKPAHWPGECMPVLTPVEARDTTKQSPPQDSSHTVHDSTSRRLSSACHTTPGQHNEEVRVPRINDQPTRKNGTPESTPAIYACSHSAMRSGSYDTADSTVAVIPHSVKSPVDHISHAAQPPILKTSPFIQHDHPPHVYGLEFLGSGSSTSRQDSENDSPDKQLHRRPSGEVKMLGTTE